MSLTFPKPAALHGDALTDELAAAGFPDAEVVDNGRGELEVDGVTDADRDGVKAVIDAHVPPPPPPDPDDELDAALAAAAAKSTVEEKIDAVIAALRGVSGPGAQGRRDTA